MMMDKRYKIEELIEKFFEGTTSNEEEKQIYSFFEREEIPEHLKKYIPVFKYFKEDIIEESNAKKEKTYLPKYTFINKKHILYILAGVAACCLLFFSIYSVFDKKAGKFDPYEGSYIVRNGVRITDMDEIRPEIEEAYRNAIQQEQLAEKKLLPSILPEKKYIEAKQRINSQYNELINNVRDESAKKEIEEIFESII